MTNSRNKLVSKISQSSHTDAQRSIDAQTAAFLKLGGKIQQIPNGVSGQVWTPSRHIKLAKPQP
ncbi:MAG TPA: hypothetical protein VGK97_08840 [Spongiibacteraceae bacterium]|jgi:hypothetical protein